MNETKDNGGPAFPHELAAALENPKGSLGAYLELRNDEEIAADIRALTAYESPFKRDLRDWFAGKAMQGELAAQDGRHQGKGTGIYMPEGYSAFAKSCYELADAMLEARKK